MRIEYYKINNKKHYLNDEINLYLKDQGFKIIYSERDFDTRTDVYFKNINYQLIMSKTTFGVFTGDGLRNLSTMTKYNKVPSKYKNVVLKAQNIA